ncbi:hypothetical protein L7F22_065967 [Adiantum nelumboides]|nr:hypothetical protein [Adiantum nelumboides]
MHRLGARHRAIPTILAHSDGAPLPDYAPALHFILGLAHNFSIHSARVVELVPGKGIALLTWPGFPSFYPSQLSHGCCPRQGKKISRWDRVTECALSGQTQVEQVGILILLPLLNAPAYDNLTPKRKPKDYKEGEQAVKFDTFHGTHDKLKALLFLQQFDAAFAGGNFTESSKIRKIFAPAWISYTFEVDVMTACHVELSAVYCELLEEYNAKFWDALLPVSSYKIVPLSEQIEKHCFGLPKGIKKYCTKTSVMNMAQLIENAEVADDLIQGTLDEDGFKSGRIKKYCTKTSVMNMAQMIEIAEVADDLIQGKPDEDGFKSRLKNPRNVDATELCKAWGKVRDQEVLVFFDPGTRANYIAPGLASKLGIRAEEMGTTSEAGLACPDHSEPVTPILGKLYLHI